MSHFEVQAAPPIPVTIGGREYLFAPLRFRDHAEAARRMRQDWPSPRAVVRRLGQGLPPGLQRELLELVYREERRGGTAELSDVLRWYRTPPGIVCHKWLMLRRHQPELSLEDVDELLTQAAVEEWELLSRQDGELNGLPTGSAGEGNADFGVVDSWENIPWQKIFAALAERWGWTPEQMSQMTIAHLLQYLASESSSTESTAPLSRDEAIQLARLRHQRREACLAELQEALDDES